MSASVETAPSARQIAVPAEARQVSTLARIDYEDAHQLETQRAGELTAEQWARAILQDAPAAVRNVLRSGWASLGIQLGETNDPDLVLGWELRRNDPDRALLAASGARLGLIGEVLLLRWQDALVVATFIEFANPVARAVWVGVGPGHRQVVRRVLDQGVHRVERRTDG